MDTLKDFEFKGRKYMPVFPKASGKPTDHIDGYPYEDDKPMSATIPHSVQLQTFFGQLLRYFAINEYVLVGADNFIYYHEGDPTKCVAPDVFVVLGVEKAASRRSFYTWAEGAVPAAVFEFLSESTAAHDRNEKVRLYLMDIGVSECFIHQPHLDEPPEFHGWRRSFSGGIVEIAPDEQGVLFSETLNLRFQWEIDQPQNVRLLRPYLPDGTPIPTDIEEHDLMVEEQHLREAAQAQAEEEAQRRQEAANPMWNQKEYNDTFYANDPWKRFSYGVAPSSSADWAWVQHMLASLEKTGRAAIVLDTGAVSRGSGSKQTNRERDIRKQFVENELIEGVILLPENLFYNTSAPGIILLLNCRKPTERKAQILLINLSNLFRQAETEKPLDR